MARILHEGGEETTASGLTVPYRFVLDEHMKPFEGLPLDLFGFGIVVLKDFEPSFVNTATPDWVIHLSAASRGFTGVITHDHSQLFQENEMRALELSGIAIITYRKGVDELTKWGLLMAYATRIVAALDRGERGAIVLPAPGAVNAQAADRNLATLARHGNVTPRELRKRADESMKAELYRLSLTDIWIDK